MKEHFLERNTRQVIFHFVINSFVHILVIHAYNHSFWSKNNIFVFFSPFAPFSIKGHALFALKASMDLKSFFSLFSFDNTAKRFNLQNLETGRTLEC